MAEYWSDFRCRQGVPLFNALIRGEPLNQHSEIWPQETRDIVLVCCKTYFDIFERFRRDPHSTSVTDRRTDFHIANTALKVLWWAATKTVVVLSLSSKSARVYMLYVALCDVCITFITLVVDRFTLLGFSERSVLSCVHVISNLLASRHSHVT